MARRWLVQLVILGFLAVQGGLVVRAAFFGGKLPWRMFSGRTNADRYLMAVAIGPTGQRTSIPLERIFRYARGSTDLRLPDNFRPLTDDTDREARDRFARFLGEWARGHDIPVASVELVWVVVDVDTLRVRARSFVTVTM